WHQAALGRRSRPHPLGAGACALDGRIRSALGSGLSRAHGSDTPGRGVIAPRQRLLGVVVLAKSPFPPAPEHPMQTDFWFTMGSTYSYLSVMRLRERDGITFRWRPFHLLIILQEMNHVPFADKPAKMAYMWRDVGRRAEMYGIPAKLPAPYPAKQSIVANL